jgi:hypothetical protein
MYEIFFVTKRAWPVYELGVRYDDSETIYVPILTKKRIKEVNNEVDYDMYIKFSIG